MSDQIGFSVLQLVPCDGQAWLATWAARHESGQADAIIYQDLISRHKYITGDDYLQMGRWKDNAINKPNRFAPNVASVAFKVWQALSQNPLPCPRFDQLDAWLSHLAEMQYEDVYRNDIRRTKHFGLSRATTVLHFLSGGEYPICDSRVRSAYQLLTSDGAVDTTTFYIKTLLPFIGRLKEQCNTSSTRELDKALFAFGANKETTILSKS